MNTRKEIIEKLVMDKKPTNVDMGNKIKEVLYSLDWLGNDLQILDYVLAAERDCQELTEVEGVDCFVDIQAIVNTGGSEGIYIDVVLRRKYLRDSRAMDLIPVMTLKTLDESLEAYASMGKLSGVITALGEWFVYANWKLIEREKVS